MLLLADHASKQPRDTCAGTSIVDSHDEKDGCQYRWFDDASGRTVTDDEVESVVKHGTVYRYRRYVKCFNHACTHTVDTITCNRAVGRNTGKPVLVKITNINIYNFQDWR